MSTHELTLLACESCGHDEFVEIRRTETRRYGYFASTDRSILMIEQTEDEESRDDSVVLRCTRCYEPAYEWLSPIGDDHRVSANRRRQQRPRSIDGEDFVRSLGFDDIADEIAERKRPVEGNESDHADPEDA